MTAVKSNATKRNLTYDITPEYLWELYVGQNKKCVLSGVPLQFDPEITASMRSN